MTETSRPRGKRAAVFFDRDGTLIHDRGYMSKPEQVQLVPYATDLLGHLSSCGYLITIVSNQSGVGRGLISVNEARAVHDRFTHLLRNAGIQLDAALYCLHAPEDNCPCRKPLPGLLLRVAERHDIDLSASFMVGDKISDCEAGTVAGCKSLLLSAAHSTGTEIPPCYEVFSDLKSLLLFFEYKSSTHNLGGSSIYEAR